MQQTTLRDQIEQLHLVWGFGFSALYPFDLGLAARKGDATEF